MTQSTNQTPPRASTSTTRDDPAKRSEKPDREPQPQSKSPQRSYNSRAPRVRVARHRPNAPEERGSASLRNASNADSTTGVKVSRFLDFAIRRLTPSDILDMPPAPVCSSSVANGETELAASSNRSGNGQSHTSADQPLDLRPDPGRSSFKSTASKSTTDLADHGLSIDQLLSSRPNRSGYRGDSHDQQDDMDDGLPRPSNFRSTGRPRSNALREAEKRPEEHPLRRPRLAPEPPFRDPFEITDDPPLPRLPDTIKGGAKFRRRKAIKAAMDAILADEEVDRQSSPPSSRSASFAGTARLFPLPPIAEEPLASSVLLPRSDGKQVIVKPKSNKDADQSSHALLPAKKIQSVEPGPRSDGKKLRAVVHATSEPNLEDQAMKDTSSATQVDVVSSAPTTSWESTHVTNSEPVRSSSSSPTLPLPRSAKTSWPVDTQRPRVITVIRIKSNAQRKGIPSFSDPADSTNASPQRAPEASHTSTSTTEENPSAAQAQESEASTQLIMKRKPKGNGRTKRLVVKSRPGVIVDQTTVAVDPQQAAPVDLASTSLSSTGERCLDTASASDHATPGAGPSRLVDLPRPDDKVDVGNQVSTVECDTSLPPPSIAHRILTKRSVSISGSHLQGRPADRPSLPRTHSEQLSRRSSSGASSMRPMSDKGEPRQRGVKPVYLNSPAMPTGPDGIMRTFGYLESEARKSSLDDVPGLTRSISDTFSDHSAMTPGASSADLPAMRPSGALGIPLPRDDRPGELFLFPPLPDLDLEEDEASQEASSSTESASTPATHSRLSSFSSLASVVGSYFPFISPSSRSTTDEGKAPQESGSPTNTSPRQSLKPIPTADWPSGSVRSRGSEIGPSVNDGDMRMSTIKRTPSKDDTVAFAIDAEADRSVPKRRKRPSMKIKIGGLDWPIDKPSPATTAVSPNEATCDTIETGDGPIDPLAFTLTPSITASPRDALANLGLPSPAASYIPSSHIGGLHDKSNLPNDLSRVSVFDVFANFDAVKASTTHVEKRSVSTPLFTSPTHHV